jgi:Arc/MetJ-type ribon-helix-helix transcriptional regulator
MASEMAIDRAFELARSGKYRSVSEVIRHLASQDRPIVEAHLAQPAARRELILICSNAWLAAE